MDNSVTGEGGGGDSGDGDIERVGDGDWSGDSGYATYDEGYSLSHSFTFI